MSRVQQKLGYNSSTDRTNTDGLENEGTDNLEGEDLEIDV